jgi:hypothetical protein
VTGGPTVPGIYVVIGPDTPDHAVERLPFSAPPDDAGRDGGAPLTALQRRMADLYAALLDEYDRALGSLPEGSERTFSGYPGLTVPLPEDDEVGIGSGESFDVIFDETLYQQLFLLYSVDGWPSVAAVESSLAEKASAPDAEPAPGGTPTLTEWSLAYRFFRSVASILALLIREALVALEHRAAELLVPGLRRYARDYAQTWNEKLKFHRDSVMLFLSRDDHVRTMGYVIGDTARGQEIFTDLLAAVKIRDEIAGLQATYNQATAQQADTAGSANLAAHLERAQTALAEQLEHIRQNSPFALLVFPGMQSYWTQSDLGHWLGVALAQTGPQAEELAKAIHPAESRTLTLFLPQVSAEGGAVDRSLLMRFDPRGPESAVIAGARQAYRKDVGFTPLLLERLWHLMADTGVIPEGSFERIVHHHYTVQMIREGNARQEAAEEASKQLARAAALLSLLLLTGPVGAAGFLLSTAAGALDLILVGDAIYTAVADLEEASMLLADRTGAPDGLTIRGLAAVAEVCSYRSEILGALGMNLALAAAGFGFARLQLPRNFQLIVLAWSFMQDVKTLVVA